MRDDSPPRDGEQDTEQQRIKKRFVFVGNLFANCAIHFSNRETASRCFFDLHDRLHGLNLSAKNKLLHRESVVCQDQFFIDYRLIVSRKEPITGFER